MSRTSIKEAAHTVHVLRTQRQRATFVRRLIREEGCTVAWLAEATGHCWATVHRYVHEVTKDPRTDTTKNIFAALGYDIAFRKRGSRGTIEI